MVLLTVLFSLVFCGAVAAADGQWKIETVDNNLGGMTSLDNSIAVDNLGNPHISYYDSNTEDLKYASKTGDNPWQTETVDSAGNVGLDTSLDLDGSNNPHISYYDKTNNLVKYAYKIDNNPWQIENVDTALTYHTSLALDNHGNPHISYHDQTTNLVKYAYKIYNNPWQIENVETVATGYTSLALDAQSNPHISYFDNTNTIVKYSYHIGGSPWEIGNIAVNIGTWENSAIAVDGWGNPYIAYTSASGLILAAWNGVSWDKTTVDPTHGGFVYDLAFDASGNPHIYYEDVFSGGNDNIQKYASLIAAGWNIQEVTRLAKGMGVLSSMALDNSGNPHISYIYYGTLVYVHFSPSTNLSDPSNSSALVKAASTSKETNSTVGMQETGTSIIGLLLASLMLLGGLITSKK